MPTADPVPEEGRAADMTEDGANGTSRVRVRAALSHREPDRVPFDFSGGYACGIHVSAYRNLLRRWNDGRRVRVENLISQRALVDEDILRRLDADFRRVSPSLAFTEALQQRVTIDDAGRSLTDDSGTIWRMPRSQGLYFDIQTPGLEGPLGAGRIDRLPGPVSPSPETLTFLEATAASARDAGFAVILDDGTCGGVFEHACCVRGHANFLLDLCARRSLAERLLHRLLEQKIAFYESVLPRLGHLVDIVAEGDDIASQQRLLISPAMYVDLLKPLHRELFDSIRRLASHDIFIHFHSCGAVRQLIPHLIDLGVDALNPVQIGADGMAPAALKQEFGADIAFWGAGVDPQGILRFGTPEEVDKEVRTRIDTLAPGGGFVFSGIHNLQPDVPPANIEAMAKAVRKHGAY
jgi:uroporphyrinogen decarboxylase